MTAQPDLARRYTPAEFKILVETSETKYEFFDGEVFEWEFMAGTSDPHSMIASTAMRRLGNALEAMSSNCVALGSDAYVAIPEENLYRLPDVTIQCAEPVYDHEFAFARTNPAVLIEVVSESSRRADYGSKFRQYSKLASLREYVLFEQTSPLCIVHSRVSGAAPWTTVNYYDLDSEVVFPSLQIEIALGTFYKDLKWTAEGVKLVPGSGIPTAQDQVGDLLPARRNIHTRKP